jgi:hypothetical protein
VFSFAFRFTSEERLKVGAVEGEIDGSSSRLVKIRLSFPLSPASLKDRLKNFDNYYADEGRKRSVNHNGKSLM